MLLKGVLAGNPVVYTAAAPAHVETLIAAESSRKVPVQLKVAAAKAGLAGTVKGRAERKYWPAFVLGMVVSHMLFVLSNVVVELVTVLENVINAFGTGIVIAEPVFGVSLI